MSKSVTSGAFVALMAGLMSLVALSIDAILPALNTVAADLHVQQPNQVQWVIGAVFLGMAVGLMIYGPLSDSFGRKPAIYAGMVVFIVGQVLSIYSQDFTTMLIGRFLQGMGAAACRVVCLAMIRDKFSGKQMAQVMSYIIMIFILVPALAPSVGQAILFVTDWRGIFVFILGFAIAHWLWLALFQEETLARENRRAFTITAIVDGIKQTVNHQASRNYMLASGVVFGGFVGYLSSSQQILQNLYQTGEWFSIIFGSLALAIGFSSFINSRLLQKLSMKRLVTMALFGIVVLATIMLLALQFNQLHVPLFIFMSYLALTFFCFGLLFGNLTTLAVQPLGHIAGVANSVIGSVQTFISVIIGGLIAHFYNQTVLPLVSGFLLAALLSLWFLKLAQKPVSQSQDMETSDNLDS